MKMKYISGVSLSIYMKKSFTILFAFLFFCGCSYLKIYANDEEEKVREYSKIEILLSDFSKKITAYYEKQNQTIPKNFDEKQFIEILKKIYPDQAKVELINKFKIKVRSINKDYSVVLCNTDTGNKLMEDLSCNLTHVEIRLWDKKDIYVCTFEENWEPYCK